MNGELDRRKDRVERQRTTTEKISRFIRLHLESETYAENMLPGEQQVEK